MTKVLVSSNNGFITKIEIQGHSGYAKAGSDIVCSAVSSTCEVVVRILEGYGKVDCVIDGANTDITVNIKNPNEMTNHILNTYVEYLCDLSQEYEKYLKIYK